MTKMTIEQDRHLHHSNVEMISKSTYSINNTSTNESYNMDEVWMKSKSSVFKTVHAITATDNHLLYILISQQAHTALKQAVIAKYALQQTLIQAMIADTKKFEAIGDTEEKMTIYTAKKSTTNVRKLLFIKNLQNTMQIQSRFSITMVAVLDFTENCLQVC